jgi:hypothetical protein
MAGSRAAAKKVVDPEVVGFRSRYIQVRIPNFEFADGHRLAAYR